MLESDSVFTQNNCGEVKERITYELLANLLQHVYT